MIEILASATHNFISHQLLKSSTEDKKPCSDPMIKVSIDLLNASDAKEATFYFAPAFIQEVSMAMLMEEAEDSDTIVDLSKETTNLIAGSAKIIGSEKALPFDIGLPNFEDMTASASADGTYRAFYIDNKPMLYIYLS